MGKGQYVPIEITFSPALLQPIALFTPTPEARLPRSQASEFYPLEWTYIGPGSNHQWMVSLVGQGHLTIMRHCRIIKASANLRH